MPFKGSERELEAAELGKEEEEAFNEDWHPTPAAAGRQSVSPVSPELAERDKKWI